MLRYLIALALALAYTGAASASTWADGLFDGLSRDFGAVPHGPTLVHHFRFVNKTNNPVQIANVRVSCGCTAAKALQTNLAPGQESAILVEMDTRRFSGSKVVTVYVQFNQPRFDEVRLAVQANSREDVSVLPESLAFGKVKRGAAAATSATVTFLGKANWQVTGVACESNYVRPQCELVRREGAEVAYKLTAAIAPDAPVGRWFTDVWLQTNNPVSPRIRVPLTVEVEAPLTVNLAAVNLGEVKAGKVAERQVIVRGIQPFRIVAVDGTDKQLSIRDTTAESKQVHMLTVTLRPQQPGPLQWTVRLLTDFPGQDAIEFLAVASVVQ
jgi:hypothetical protein